MAGSPGSSDATNQYHYQSNEPTQNHEPVQPGSTRFKSEDSEPGEPTLTGSRKMTGSSDSQEYHDVRDGEPGEPGKPGGIEKKFSHIFSEDHLEGEI
jgi:hypothetical protein